MHDDQPYRHTQRAPLCLLIYAIGGMFLLLGWGLRNEPVVQWVIPIVGLMMLILAVSFHHLTVEDEGDCLSISFGPIQLFRRAVQYENIVSVETGRTTILDGWGRPSELWHVILNKIVPHLVIEPFRTFDCHEDVKCEGWQQIMTALKRRKSRASDTPPWETSEPSPKGETTWDRIQREHASDETPWD